MHRIRNLTRKVVLLRFNSGAEKNIAPLSKLEDIVDTEVRNNPVLEKLHKQGVIDVAEMTQSEALAGPAVEKNRPETAKVKS